MPVCSAAPWPRLSTWRKITAPGMLACWRVSSTEPSSVTTTAQCSATSSFTTERITRPSLNAAITTHVDRRDCSFTTSAVPHDSGAVRNKPQEREQRDRCVTHHVGRKGVPDMRVHARCETEEQRIDEHGGRREPEYRVLPEPALAPDDQDRDGQGELNDQKEDPRTHQRDSRQPRRGRLHPRHGPPRRHRLREDRGAFQREGD